MFKTTFFAVVFLNNGINLDNEFSELVPYGVVIIARWIGSPIVPLVRMHIKNFFYKKAVSKYSSLSLHRWDLRFFFGWWPDDQMNTLKHTTYNKTISYVHVATHEVTGSQRVNSNTTHTPTRQIHPTYVTANPGQLSLQHSGFSLQCPLLSTVRIMNWHTYRNNLNTRRLLHSKKNVP